MIDNVVWRVGKLALWLGNNINLGQWFDNRCHDVATLCFNRFWNKLDK